MVASWDKVTLPLISLLLLMRMLIPSDVLLQWDDMPDFCRLCQLTGYCPDYQKYLKCHVMRNCPRNNAVDTAIAPNKKRVTVPTKERKAPSTSVETPILPPINSLE
jgi:hypothetical protein